MRVAVTCMVGAALLSGCGARTGLAVVQAEDAGLREDAGLTDVSVPRDAFVARDAVSPPTDAASCGVPVSLPTRLWAAQSGTRTSTRRPDLHVDTTMWEQTPTLIVDVTLAVKRPAASTHLVIAGDAAGTAPWGIDNFALFEVFDCSGRRVGVALAGFVNGTVTQDGEPVAQLDGNAFDHDAGAVSLDSLVPVGGVYTLHASALDYGGWESVSETYLVAE